MTISNCLVCKEQFTTNPRAIKLGKGKYCSRACSGKGRKKNIALVCKNCGKVFIRKASRARLNNIRYCSRECGHKSRETRKEKNCKVCGSKFFAGADALAKNMGIFCSRKCAAVGKKKRGKGEAAIIRFLSRVVVLPGPNSCWIYEGKGGTTGYGMLRIDGAPKLVHRFSYEFFRTPLGNRIVCHHCDIPRCVNPKHLFEGTRLENNQDCVKKGRHSSVLTKEQVVEIISQPHVGVRALAEKYKVSKSAIDLIRCNINWKHIPRPIRTTPRKVRQAYLLTKDQVIEILAQGNVKGSILAKKYNTSQSNVYLIRSGKSWKHIPRN